MNFKTDNPSQNIEIAENILKISGINSFSFLGYSSSNGISVYFKNENGLKIRVSDHSVTNLDRIFNELHLSFDKKLWGFGGKISFKDCSDSNRINSARFGY